MHTGNLNSEKTLVLVCWRPFFPLQFGNLGNTVRYTNHKSWLGLFLFQLAEFTAAFVELCSLSRKLVGGRLSLNFSKRL